MKKLLTQTLPQPYEPKIVIRFLLVIIVILTFIAGYFHSLWELDEKRIESLETTQYSYFEQTNY